jgi:hypothetical protein
MYTYTINGVTYIQKPLVFAQIKQLTSVIGNIASQGGIDVDSGAVGLIEALGDNLTYALAVALTPEGTNLRDKDLEKLADEIEYNILPGQILQAVTDFFVCNPILSLLEQLQGMTGSIRNQVTSVKTGLSSLSASSPEETLPGGKSSSGKSRHKNADRT